MTTARYLATAALLLLVVSAETGAQSRPYVSLAPPDNLRWDVAAYGGRQGVNKSEIGPGWDDWYESASFAASAGFYWTPHLKLEVDAGRSAQADFYSVETVGGPELPYPYTRSRRHRFTTASGSAAVVYQAFENRWFHPFVTGGVELINERQRSEALGATAAVWSGTRIIAPALPPLAAVSEASLFARPFAGMGFKVYVSPRAFLRSDLRVSLSRSRPESVTWRAGGGFDF
jgi:hypothetical protein